MRQINTRWQKQNDLDAIDHILFSGEDISGAARATIVGG